MSDTRDDAEFLEFCESLLLPSVVLVEVNGAKTQTGFFISNHGDICTCFHGLLLREDEPIHVVWQERRFDAVAEAQVKAADFALLRIVGEEAKNLRTPALPIDLDSHQIGHLDFHSAITLGYAGLESPDLPVAQRLFLGQLGKTRSRNLQQRIEFTDLGVGKGNSGAPIFDLKLFCVIGYVRSVTSKVQRLGDGLSLQHLIRLRPDLLAEWQQAQDEVNEKVVHFYRANGKSFNSSELSIGIITKLIEHHNQKTINSFLFSDRYVLQLYKKREAQRQIDDFLADPEKKLLVVSGTTGSGKTNVLLHLVEEVEAQNSIAVFINYSEINSLDFWEAVSPIFNMRHLTMPEFHKILRRFSGQRWVLILDGFNEWEYAYSKEFKRILRELAQIIEVEKQVDLKVIFGIRSEFLQEKIPSFYFPKQSFESDFPATHLIYFDDVTHKPYIELHYVVNNRCFELEEMYEHYYQMGSFVSSSGRVIGIRPQYSFKQLDKKIQQLLTCPIILKLFMIRYHDRQVPEITLRSSFIDDILKPVIPEDNQLDINSEGIYFFLMHLAYFTFQSNDGKPCALSDLLKQPWYKSETLEYLLVSNIYIQRNRVTQKGDLFEKNQISFTSDWMFEYFLAVYIWEQCRNLKEPDEKLRWIGKLQKMSFETSVDAHLLGSLLFIGEWAITKDESFFPLILHLMNSEEWKNLNSSFTHSYLDCIRTGYTFNTEIILENSERLPAFIERLFSNRQVFNEVGISRILNYVEHLENLGEGKDALTLLNVSDEFWGSASSLLQNRRNLSLAFNSFVSHEVEAALQYAALVDLKNLPSNLVSKHSLIVGRCYQFKQEYTRARTVYEKSISSATYFGYRCLHQLAFVEVIANSNYVKAAQILEELLSKMSLSFTFEEQCTSRNLHAQCLREIGMYSQAQNSLEEIVRCRSHRRNQQALGKALGSLGEVYLRQFNTQRAIETLNDSVNRLEGISYFLSKAHSLDIRASAHAILTGNLNIAEQDIAAALDAYRQTNHTAGLSWSLQTQAWIKTIEGNQAEAEGLLEQARQYTLSPNQQLRETFIRLQAHFFNHPANPAEFKKQTLALQESYTAQGFGWYPGLLALMLAALDKAEPKSQVEALKLFKEDIDADQMMKSYYFTKLFE